MKHVLVIEDNPDIAKLVSLHLQDIGAAVQTAHNGNEGYQLANDKHFDLVVLDLMLPQVDGLSITRWIRDRSDVPIIMLTARRGEADRIAGLEMGADDYVVKPFSPQELVSRVRAVLRRTRSTGETISEQPIIFDKLQINPVTRLVSARGEEIVLTAKEFDMLWQLARHPRQVFTRDQLLERVWGMSDFIDPGTVTVHVRRLREKIEVDASNPEHILTVWGVGYKFEP